MKQKVFSSFLSLVMMFVFAFGFAACGTNEGALNFTMIEDGSGYEVSGISMKREKQIIIPATHEGIPVKSIGPGAFLECDSITSIVIPESVTSIGSNAFYGCNSLVSAVFENKTGWQVIDSLENERISIEEDDLSVPALSAKYLRDDYVGYKWECKKVLSTDDIIGMGYVNKVTFDLMGGKSGERTELVQYVKDNSLVVEPGSSTLAGEVPTRSGYTFGGYCLGTKDADGNVTYGKTWDFMKDRVTSDITLYAVWLINYSINVHYGDGYGLTYAVSVSQTASGKALPIKSIDIPGQTVLQNAFYLSAEDAENKTNAVTFPYTPSNLSQEHTVSELWANTLSSVCG